VPENPRESLDAFRSRVEKLESTTPTSPLLFKIGWPVLAVGLVIWIICLFLPGAQFFTSLFSLALIGLGLLLVGMSYVSSHSEGVEKSERARRIKDRNSNRRCIHLEGNVPEGKGSVGRCRHYEFDMVDYPYCIYCREYSPGKGSPKM